MKVELYAPFLNSLVEVLSKVTKTKVKYGRPYFKKERVGIAAGDISSVMGLVSPTLKGSIALSFSRSAILNIAYAWLGSEFREGDEDTADLACELTNMVAAGARNKLLDSGHRLNEAVPLAVFGEKHLISHNADEKIFVLPIRTADGQVYLELCLVEEKEEVKAGPPKMRVLVVDDSRTARSVVKRMLGQMHITDIDQAVDGREAIDKVKESDYDLITLDWAMPRMNGLDFLKYLRDQSIRQPAVLMVTAENHRDFVQQAIMEGANGYIVKPFDQKTFMEKARLAIQMHKARQAQNESMVDVDSSWQIESRQDIGAGTHRNGNDEFCTECGEDIPDGASYCTSCGEPHARSKDVRRPELTLASTESCQLRNNKGWL